MAEKTTAVEKSLPQPDEKGTGFLLWGWVFVTILNMAMVIGALALFGP